MLQREIVPDEEPKDLENVDFDDFCLLFFHSLQIGTFLELL
jgi:hypothetical protein